LREESEKGEESAQTKRITPGKTEEHCDYLLFAPCDFQPRKPANVVRRARDGRKKKKKRRKKRFLIDPQE